MNILKSKKQLEVLKSLVEVTPAMEARIEEHVWDWSEFLSAMAN
jgi:hypothetical protein